MVGQWVSIFPMVDLRGFKNVYEFDVNSISEESPIVYFLKFDLEYPDELHELHNDYPLAPRKVICCENFVKKLLISMK